MKHDEINRRARQINTDSDVRQKAIRTHAGLVSYFDGEDLTGTIKGTSVDVYAAFISVLTGSGIPEFENQRKKSHEALHQVLENTFKEAGFVDSDGSLLLPGRDDYSSIPSTSIGPILPAMVAILEVEYGIDSTEAVRQYRPNSLQVILPDEDDDSQPAIEDRSKQDWEMNIRDAPGFDPHAEAYVYVLKLKRRSDSSTWFYVGKRESGFSGLLTRIQSHARNFNQSRVITRQGQEILAGDYNASLDQPGTTHQVVEVERIVPISDAELSTFDSSGAKSCYVTEVERRTAYKVAIDHQTTNMLGGK